MHHDVRRHRAGGLLIDALDDDGIGYDDDHRVPLRRRSALKPIDQAALQAVVEKATKEMLVPGAFVEIRTPQGSYTAAVGTTELGKQTPPDTNTHFRIASNSKTMTAALIVLLAQDGKLKFSDPVSDYVPDVPNGTNITSPIC